MASASNSPVPRLSLPSWETLCSLTLPLQCDSSEVAGGPGRAEKGQGKERGPREKGRRLGLHLPASADSSGPQQFGTRHLCTQIVSLRFGERGTDWLPMPNSDSSKDRLVLLDASFST